MLPSEPFGLVVLFRCNKVCFVVSECILRIKMFNLLFFKFKQTLGLLVLKQQFKLFPPICLFLSFCLTLYPLPFQSISLPLSCSLSFSFVLSFSVPLSRSLSVVLSLPLPLFRIGGFVMFQDFQIQLLSLILCQRFLSALREDPFV